MEDGRSWIDKLVRRDWTREPEDDDAVDFLLAELQTLQQLRSASLGFINQLLTLYGAFASVVIGATAISQALLRSSREKVLLAIGCGVLAFSFFGVVLTYRALSAQISATQYVWGMNRIRRFFVERYPEIAPYILLPIHDDYPELLAFQLLHGQNRILRSTAVAVVCTIIFLALN